MRRFLRDSIVAVALAATFFLSASDASAKVQEPWGAGLRLGGGYTVTAPYNNLEGGPFFTTELELRYTGWAGAGMVLMLGGGTAVYKITPNDYDKSVSFAMMPIEAGFIYEYPGRKVKPYGMLTVGYTLWVLDRDGFYDDGGINRMNMAVRGGLGIKVWRSLLLDVGLVYTMPGLFGGGEKMSHWLGLETALIWNF